MNETFPQPNQEKNIALERPSMVKEHNELVKEWEALDSFDQNLVLQERGSPRNIEIYNRKNELYSNVTNIDKYREIAKSKESINTFEIGDISDNEKMIKEKEKIDSEIKKMVEDIESTAIKINSLRHKLGMPPSKDIPSLIDKKENLGNLLVIQKDLENKLNFEIKKQEVIKSENIDQNVLEQKFIKDDLEGLSFALRGIVNNQDSFGFGIIASGLNDYSDIDDLKSKLSKIVTSVENFTKNGLRDDLNALLQDASKLGQIEASLRNLTSKINNEEERKSFGQFISGVADKISENVAFIKFKASKMQEYLNTNY